MSTSVPILDPRRLAQLVPLNSLSAENFKDLAQRLQIETLAAGRTLFKCGDQDTYSYYLLEGELELRDAKQSRAVLQAGMPVARHPICPQQPRIATAIARTEIRFIRVDTDLLDILLTWDQSSGYVVADLESDNGSDEADWMSRMLGSKVFHQVPPANIQEIFRRMESVAFKPGEVVMRQGDPGDYYYVVRQGRVLVTRRAPSGTEVRLAELSVGAGFGEEALMAECERNASVTVLTDATLMRLSKGDFDSLLKTPLLHEFDYQEGLQLARNGACWLDVRLESEHQNMSIPGSLNIPLCLLRLQMRELDPETTYLLYCDTGRRSAAAAYLLSEAGFDVQVLAGGCRHALPADAA